MKNWFSKLFTNSKTEDTIRYLELRIMGLEQDVHHLKGLLKTDSISLAGMSTKNHEEHFDVIVSKSVMKWLGNWADDKFVSNENLDDAVSDSISNGSFVSDEVESVLDNEDWDYRLRDCFDWDKVADKVSDKLDWSQIISDNEIVCQGDYDFDDFMLQSEQMSDDDVMTRSDLSEEIANELKRSWFTSLMSEQVNTLFDTKLQMVRNNEHENCINAIDDEIVTKVGELVQERMRERFGAEWDDWFNANVRFNVKTILGEFLASAYEQTKEGNK